MNLADIIDVITGRRFRRNAERHAIYSHITDGRGLAEEAGNDPLLAFWLQKCKIMTTVAINQYICDPPEEAMQEPGSEVRVLKAAFRPTDQAMVKSVARLISVYVWSGVQDDALYLNLVRAEGIDSAVFSEVLSKRLEFSEAENGLRDHLAQLRSRGLGAELCIATYRELRMRILGDGATADLRAVAYYSVMFEFCLDGFKSYVRGHAQTKHGLVM